MGLFIRRCKGIALYVYHHVSCGIDKAAGRRDNKPKMLIIYCIMMIASYIIMYIFSMKSWITISYDAASIVKTAEIAR